MRVLGHRTSGCIRTSIFTYRIRWKYRWMSMYCVLSSETFILLGTFDFYPLAYSIYARASPQTNKHTYIHIYIHLCMHTFIQRPIHLSMRTSITHTPLTQTDRQRDTLRGSHRHYIIRTYASFLTYASQRYSHAFTRTVASDACNSTSRQYIPLLSR